MTQLFERIRKIRKLANASQEVFANSLGVSRGHVSNLETGAAVPSEQLIKSICREYGVREEWLKEGTGLLKKKPELTLEELHSLELDLGNTVQEGLCNQLDSYDIIIHSIMERIFEFKTLKISIDKPNGSLLRAKEQLENSIDLLKFDVMSLLDRPTGNKEENQRRLQKLIDEMKKEHRLSSDDERSLDDT